MMRRLLPTLIVLVTAGHLAATASACGGGSNSEVTPSPTASGPADLSPRVGGVEAAQRYLLDTGIDGKKGHLTDPQSCADITDKTEGVFCVHENFSTYASGLVILRIARSNKPAEDVWEMRLSLTNGQWQVTSVEPFGVSQ